MTRRRWLLRDRLTGRRLTSGSQFTLRRQRRIWVAFYAHYGLPADLHIEPMPCLTLVTAAREAGAL